MGRRIFHSGIFIFSGLTANRHHCTALLWCSNCSRSWALSDIWGCLGGSNSEWLQSRKKEVLVVWPILPKTTQWSWWPPVRLKPNRKLLTRQLVKPFVHLWEVTLTDLVLKSKYVVWNFLCYRKTLLWSLNRQHGRFSQIDCHFYSIIFDFSWLFIKLLINCFVIDTSIYLNPSLHY